MTDQIQENKVVSDSDSDEREKPDTVPQLQPSGLEEGVEQIDDAEEVDGDDLKCRFYRNEWPERDDLVIVEIVNVNEHGAYVRLLEYNNREALILASSVTRKRVKNVKKLLRVGTQDCMQVVGIDNENGHGFIDLSKRNMQVSDMEKKKVQFDKAKIVHLIMKLTAKLLKCKLIELYEQFGWDLYDNFDHAYDALKLCLSEPDLVFKKINITPQQREILLANIQKKMAAAPTKLRCRFNLQCYTYEGIEAIKASLLSAKGQTSDNDFQLIFQLIAPPEYKAEVVTLDKQGGMERLEKALAIIQSEMKERGGIFKLIQAPAKIGSSRDEIEDIKANMAKKEEEETSNEDEEDEEEGIDVELQNDDMQLEEDDDEN